MRIISSLAIPEMFTAYAEDLGYTKNGLHHIQYFCENCDQAFSAAWGRLEHAMSYCERGSRFRCPHCGKEHDRHVVYVKRNNKAIHSAYLAVKEFKNAVTFEISCGAVYFNDYFDLYETGYKEVFKFDIASQTATFTSYSSFGGRGKKNEVLLLGNPLDLKVLEISILRYFVPFSLANSEKRSEMNHLLKTLRETVHSKLEKHLGHPISSMHVSSGQIYGTFLLPLFNIAYRVTFPDAPNLPKIFREDTKAIQKAMDSKMISKNQIDRLIELSRNNQNLLKSILNLSSLPDKPFVRRTLNEDLFSFGLLSKAFSLCSNYDLACRLYIALATLAEDVRLRWSLSKDLFNFLRIMKRFYGELGIVRLVENYEEMRLYDCANLYKQLSRENKRAIKAEAVRLRDLHDWMSLKHKMQTHKNIKFNVPEHIVRRLSMQKDKLRFFLPDESMQLLKAGHDLHNCVASYGEYMKDHKKWIVLVADDQGKLAACMELVGDELVQAKADRNIPVANFKALNDSVVAWATERKIKIKTWDVSVTKDKSKIVISA